ncbi:MAG: stage III sporulation protein D [Bacilli bacterium]|jgi:putative DeoR family transcriptional regulator (stage III sporulation protein D)|nr:stage III sporulation protein D [Bacilli bacterium]
MCNNILDEADYILVTKVTIREAASYFNISKSALHRHMKNLKYIDFDKYLKIKKVFLEHNKIRHINGGLATKKKFNG